VSLGLGGIAEAFADRNFRWYSLGSIISWLSFFVQAVAVSWTAWDLTHSTAWLAIVALADATANIVLMPIGGVLADRQDRLRMLLIGKAKSAPRGGVAEKLASDRRAVYEARFLSVHRFISSRSLYGSRHRRRLHR